MKRWCYIKTLGNEFTLVLVNFFNVIKCIILNNPLVNFVEEEILLQKKKKRVYVNPKGSGGSSVIHGNTHERGPEATTSHAGLSNDENVPLWLKGAS